MLFEYIETDLNLQLFLGLILGTVFGIAAQITRFCLRRAVAGESGSDKSALAVWITALAVAIGSFQIANATGFAALEEHRYLAGELPIVAILVGGLAFGAGMVQTRGCVSRLTVLSASGNLRAVTVLATFALLAHATLKGVFAPLRTSLGNLTLDLPFASLADIPGAAVVVPAALLVTAVALARRSSVSALHLALGGVIGLVATAGWVSTSVLLMDEFDPSPVQSVAFTLPWTDGLFWLIASTAIPAGFGVGLIGGVLSGAFVSALLRGELELVSFSAPDETLRYISGGALMGVGGVLAGGCTVGAGLSGSATLSIAALLALASIIAGAVVTRRVMSSNVAQPALG